MQDRHCQACGATGELRRRHNPGCFFHDGSGNRDSPIHRLALSAMVDPKSVMPEGDPSPLFQLFLLLNFLFWLWVTPKIDRWLRRFVI